MNRRPPSGSLAPLTDSGSSRPSLTFEGTSVTQTPNSGKPTGTLSAMLLPELRSIANQLGIKGARQMRKADLITAIREAGWPEDGGAPGDGAGRSARTARKSENRLPAGDDSATNPAGDESSASRRSTSERAGENHVDGQDATAHRGTRRRAARSPRRESPSGNQRHSDEQQRAQTSESVGALLDAQSGDHDQERSGDRQSGNTRSSGRGSRGSQDSRGRSSHDPGDHHGSRQADGANADVTEEVGARLDALAGRNHDDEASENSAKRGGNRHDGNRRDDDNSRNDSEYGGRRNRRRRQRDRQGRRPRRNGYNDSEPNLREDDVLVPCNGILDIRDQYAFVRTSGYLPSSEDAYVSMSMVRRNGLRKGDVISGQMRAKRENDRREKFAPLARIESVNGLDPEKVRQRPEFSKLTPLYPQERLRLEDSPKNMTGRIIDLVSPIGKGQRGLIVSPPKAGKTMIMQSVANSITTNNPEAHLMIVLVDERPEEVTDFQRTVSGEVIASTFDRPADDHTQVAELAIERAKRLVEMGQDVVILLDGITRLGRAYNLAAPASGRILSGGVDSAALYPPKKFFGAARNIENGGSLTILATALVETGSKMDEVIFEEFKGTGNMELRLRREFANKRLFPAIDVDASSTRREELLLSREETAIMWKLRRVLSGLEDSQALEMLLSKLRRTQTNAEFLYTISKTTPSVE